jgi:hypothetical protein
VSSVRPFYFGASFHGAARMEDLYLAVPAAAINHGRWPTIPISPKISWREAAEEVARTHGQSLDSVLQKSSRTPVCVARWAVFALLSGRGWSSQKIAHLFGMDHTTVLYGLKRHAGTPASETRP